MTQHFDIAVLGSGPGGYVAALRAGQLGATVAIVEKGHLGGACLNVGCIPSKALLASAELLHRAGQASEMGIVISGPVGFDWPKIQARKDKAIQTLRTGIKSLLAARKVTLFQGTGRLNGPGRFVVNKDDGAAEEFTASKAILAVGSAPSRIAGWPSDPNIVCTSDEALHWKELPRRLLIVGGGVIGCEFACMLQPFGVELTVVEMMPRLLPEMDGGFAEPLLKIFTRRGIKCFLDTKVQDLAVVACGVKATLTGGQVVEADKVLVATGRRPSTGEIGLETAGLTTDGGFIRVSDTMETPVKGYYGIGDANGRCLLAHAASAHGIVAAENALGGSRAFGEPVPNCVYTFPEIASVGLSQEQAKAKGVPVAIGSFPLSYLGKAKAAGDTEGFVKVIRHRETGQLLGAHMMGHNVTECIAAAGAMMHEKASVREVAEMVVAHPTISEALKEAAQDALSMAIHLPPRKMLRVTAG